jgi:hypothetical protein
MGQKNWASGFGLMSGLTSSGRENGPIAQSGKRTTGECAIEPMAMTDAVIIVTHRQKTNLIVSCNKYNKGLPGRPHIITISRRDMAI